MSSLCVPINNNKDERFDDNITSRYLLYTINLNKNTEDISWGSTAIYHDKVIRKDKFGGLQKYFKKRCYQNTCPALFEIYTYNKFPVNHEKNKEDALKTENIYLGKIGEGTISIFLGIYLKALIEIQRYTIKKDWSMICVTGDIIYDEKTGSLKLSHADKVYDKYKGEFEELALKSNEKFLFLYISDDKEDSLNHEKNENITVEWFSPKDNTIEDIINYLFEPFDYNYDLKDIGDFKPEQIKLIEKMRDDDGKDKYCNFIPGVGFEAIMNTVLNDLEWQGFIIHGEKGAGKTTNAMVIARFLTLVGRIYAPLWINVDNDDVRERIKKDNYEASKNNKNINVNVEEYFISYIEKKLFNIDNYTNESISLHEKMQHIEKKLTGKQYLIVINDISLPENDVTIILNTVKYLFYNLGIKPYFIITTRYVKNNQWLKMFSPPELNKEKIDILVQKIARNEEYNKKIERAREKKCYEKVFLQLLYDNFRHIPGIIIAIVKMFESLNINSIINILQTKIESNAISEKEKIKEWEKWFGDWIKFIKLKHSLTPKNIMRYYHAHMIVYEGAETYGEDMYISVYYGSMLADSQIKPISLQDFYSAGAGIISINYSIPHKEINLRPPYVKSNEPKGGYSKPEITANEDEDSLFANGEVIFLTKLTGKRGGVGLHIPYYTEYVTFTVDMSQISLKPESELRARLRYMNRGVVDYDLLETHQYENKNIWIISASNVSSNSSIEFSWGDHETNL